MSDKLKQKLAMLCRLLGLCRPDWTHRGKGHCKSIKLF